MLKINRKNPIKYIFSGLIVIALAAAGFFLWNNPKATSASWWNDSWAYRKAIDITNNVSAQNNVYISLTLNTDTASTSMQADCGDFRFITESGEILQYFIESGCRSTTTLIHVAFTTFPAGQQTIYYYYGNPSADNGFSISQSGSVTQANMRLSIATSTAFVDFSSSNSLTPYLGRKLSISDSAGKKLKGYIKSAGTGETYGSELLANTSFDNTTNIDAWQTTVASVAGGQSGNCLQETLSSGQTTGNASGQVTTTVGALYYGTVYIKKGTGIDSAMQFQHFGDDYHVLKLFAYLAAPANWTQYSDYAVGDATALSYVYQFWSGTAGQTMLFDTASVVQVLTPSVTGVTIASSSNGAVYNWASEDNGFNRNNSSGYSYVIYPQAFNIEASNYTIGAVGSEETGPGPVAYWSFDEGYGATAHDNTVNKNDATITGAAWQEDSMCVVGKCLSFDGADDYIQSAENRGLPAYGNPAYTISMWVKGAASQLDKKIFAEGNSTGNASGGSVDLANTRMSVINGMAFVDFSSAGTLTSYLGNKIIITDSTGKKLTGFIKAAGTAETYGAEDASNSSFDNLVSVWNMGPTSQTVLATETVGCHAGNCLRATIYSADIYGGWQVITNNAQDGSLYKYSCWAKQDTTSDIDMWTAYSSGVQPGQNTGWVRPNSWTQYTLYQTTNNSGQWNKLNWYIHDAAGKSALFDDASAKQVITPSVTGVTITSAPNGSIYNWASEESGFNRNDPSGYTYKIYPPSFTIGTDSTASGKLKVYIQNNDGSAPLGVSGAISGSDVFDGNWHHIEWTDSNGTVKLYIDGQLDSANFNYTKGVLNMNRTAIGAFLNASASSNFAGKIDEAKVYPYARSEDQIKQDYAAGLAGVQTDTGVSAAFGSASEKWMSDGLVGYWKLDESTTSDGFLDSSGNGNIGYVNGGASTTAGKYGNGIASAVNSDYIWAGNNPVVNITDEITLSTWVRQNDFVSLSNSYPITKGNSYSLIYGWEGNNCGFILTVDGVATSTDRYNFSDSDKTGWHNIVGTYSKTTRTLKFYVDGIERESKTLIGLNSYEITTSANTLYLGFQASASRLYQMDETRIYNRALSADEVRNLYEWAPGPTGYWKMDEKISGDSKIIADSSGNDNNGTIHYGANATGMDCTVLGKYGSACQFDGIDDYAQVPHKYYFAQAPFTASAWVKLNQLPGDKESVELIFNKFYGVPPWNSWRLEGANWDNKFNFFVYNSLGGSGQVWSDSVIVVGTWYYVTVTLDSNNEMRMYVNGVLQAKTANAGGSMLLDNSTLNIGIDYPGGNTINGSIDQAIIYNYVRSQKQILEDMSGGGRDAKARLFPSLQLSLDEGKSGTANDSSIYKNNGTLHPGTGGTNTATSAMWTFDGKFGRALEFDGTDDYVEVANNSSIDFADEDFSYSFWMKANLADLLHNDRILLKGTGAGGCGLGKRYEVYIESPSRLFFAIDDNVVKTSFYRNLANYADGGWHQVTFTKNVAANELKVFRDGVLDGPVVEDGTGDISNSCPLYLGRDTTVGSEPKMLLDEVKIYPYALTEDEVEKDYNQGKMTVMGNIGTSASAASSSNSAGFENCVPGSTDYCASPVGEWKFNEMTGGIAYDSSGNGYDSNITGATWTRGNLGGGLHFRGPEFSDYADISPVSNFYTPPFTASVWLKFDNLPVTVERIITQLRASAPWIVWDLEALDSNKKLFFVVNDSGGTGHGVSSNSAVVPNTWYNVVTTLDASYNLAMYVNGAQQAQTGNSVSIANNAGNLRIGGSLNETNTFPGIIDNVKIYNYVRTPAQIAWEYNRGKPVAYWNFDECSGGIIHDNSGNGNHGTLNLGASGVTSFGTCASSSNSFWYNGRSGKYNSAGSFEDGIDDYVSVSNVDLSGTNVITLSFWLKWYNFADNDRLAMEFTDDFNNHETGFIIDPNEGFKGQFGVGLKGNVGKSNVKFVRPTPNVWHNYLIIMDKGKSSQEIDKVYVDGIAQSLSIIDSNNDNTNNFGKETLYIMSRGGSDLFGAGQIDEVKIFNYALTAEQVKQEYSGGAVKFGN